MELLLKHNYKVLKCNPYPFVPLILDFTAGIYVGWYCLKTRHERPAINLNVQDFLFPETQILKTM